MSESNGGRRTLQMMTEAMFSAFLGMVLTYFYNYEPLLTILVTGGILGTMVLLDILLHRYDFATIVTVVVVIAAIIGNILVPIFFLSILDDIGFMEIFFVVLVFSTYLILSFITAFYDKKFHVNSFLVLSMLFVLPYLIVLANMYDLENGICFPFCWLGLGASIIL